MAEHKVIFLPDGIQKNVAEGTTIMAAAAEAGVELEGPCGGRGTCGKCRVLVKARGEEEWVLACKTPVTEDMTIEIPQAAVALHRKSALTETDVHIKIEPGIKKKAIKVKEATVEYQASDTERLLSELGNALKVFNLEALKSLPKAVRKSQGLVTVTMTDDEILAVEPGDVTGRLFGIAVDIGTTTIVVSLVNLLNGETLSTASATNAQNIFGADVIARIEHVMKQAQGLEQLQRRVVNVINRLIEKLSEECSVAPQEIVKVSIAGNTTMGHLFLGLDPSAIAPAPFTPVVRHDVQVEGKQVGLKVYPAAKVTVLPNIAGYVGADTIAVILATNIYQEKGVTLAIDIGTNGEMVLSVNGNLMACSTAAGPAFEGAHIKQGMRAAAGAIEGVRIEEDVMLRVIGNTAAKGICGSGLIDAIAELVRVGIIDQSGKLLGKEEAEHLPDNLRDRLSTDSEGRCFILQHGAKGNPEVVLTQKDVRELQLAKGAIRAGIDTMLQQAGLRYEEIDRILLAGAFGNYIDKKSAQTLGLLPPLPLDKVTSVGNAAGMGAKLALLSTDLLRKAGTLATGVNHIELSSRADFQAKFMDALYFA